MNQDQSISTGTLQESNTRHPLEERARAFSEQLHHETWDPSPLSMLEREITLSLHHIDRTKQLHDKLHRSLLYAECYIGTELYRLPTQILVYSPTGLSARHHLQGILLDIEKERRNLAITREEKLQQLQERLLTLLNQHALLDL